MLHPFQHDPIAGPPAVEFRAVTCGYEQHVVLRDVQLSIPRGDFVGLLGPSGAGKSTLLRAMLGAVRLFSGAVLVDGVPIHRKRPRVGYVPQLETIDWTFPVTVEEAAMMGCVQDSRMFPWYRRHDRRRALEVMERLGIVDLRRRHIRELSGGQQQRVFLARALLSNPSLLLLDEPTAGVDLKTRDDILHLLDELNHQDVTIIIATHEINAVAAHLPRVVCVKGKVVAEGTPAEVITPDVLRATYDADMPVTQYQGMTLVTERPHWLGRNGHRARAPEIAHAREAESV